MKDDELFSLMHEHGSMEWDPKGELELRSGLRTAIRIDLGRRDLTEHMYFLALVGKKIRSLLKAVSMKEPEKQLCLIGVPTAGIPLAQAAAMAGDHTDDLSRIDDVVFRILRPNVQTEGPKARQRLWMDGDPDPSQHYLLMENVLSTGGSLLSAYSKVLEHGYSKKQISVLVLVDRELSGMRRLKEAGITEIAVGWKITELVGHMQELGFLPDDALSVVEEEIREFHNNPLLS